MHFFRYSALISCFAFAISTSAIAQIVESGNQDPLEGDSAECLDTYELSELGVFEGFPSLCTKDPLVSEERNDALVGSESGGKTTCVAERACLDNTDGQALGQCTRDKCVVQGAGAECKPGFCCDWDKAGPGRKCECNTNINGFCNSPASCAVCMLLAEAGGEPKGDCQKAVLCAIQNRAKKTGSSICDTVLKKSGRSGDAPAFDSSKCICDRKDPSPGTGYNQTYCECCEAVARGESPRGYADVLEVYNSLDCSKKPFSEIYYFNGNGTVPCTGGLRQVGPTSGRGKCEHKFYACPYP